MKTNQKLIDRLHNVDNSIYESIMEAIKKEVRIDFDALDAEWCKEMHYEIYPFVLKRDRACWLYGFTSSGELRTVLIESIHQLVVTAFEAPSAIWNNTMMERCRCSIGSTFLNETPQIVSDLPIHLSIVILKIYAPYNHYVLLYPFHFSQELINESKEEGYYLFRYYIEPTQELVLRILELGDKVEVLSPLTLRDETRRMIRRMLMRYE